jgi:hypothetical protein
MLKLLKIIYFTHVYVELIFREDQLSEIINLFESKRTYYKIYDLEYVSPISFGIDPDSVQYWAKKDQLLDNLTGLKTGVTNER